MIIAEERRSQMEKKELAYKLYRFINAIPFNNKKKGGVEIINRGAILLNCRIYSHGTGNRLIFNGKGFFQNCEFILYGDQNTIEFGENCTARNGSFYTEDSRNMISTGENTHYAGIIHIACTESTRIEVGKNCLFSSDIMIRSGDSHSILNMQGDRINFARNVTICDHVWVGNRAIITKGAVIPEDSVVGTGAIVTRAFSDKNVVLAGVPAQIVKRDITWCHDRI